MTTSGVRRTAGNALLFLASCAVAFGLGELAVRFLFKDQVSLFPRYHTDAKYGEFTLRSIRPNSVFRHTSVDGSWEYSTNAQGFRNRKDFTYEKPPGTVRVLSLGDSQTQGYEVRQDFTYSAVIEKYLNARGHQTEVMNTGVSGFSTAEELLFLENEGVRYQPDVVIVGFYANDMEDNIKAGLFRLNEDGSLSVAKTEHLPGVGIQNLIYSIPTVKWLSENSYFYSLLFNSVWEFYKARLSSDASAAVTEYAIPTAEEASDYQIALTAALLARLYEFCRSRNIELILMDIPRISGSSSLPSSILERSPEYGDALIDGPSLLADYAGAAELHIPHGAMHISEFTHAILGVAAAKQIESWLQEPDLLQLVPAPFR